MVQDIVAIGDGVGMFIERAGVHFSGFDYFIILSVITLIAAMLWRYKPWKRKEATYTKLQGL